MGRRIATALFGYARPVQEALEALITRSGNEVVGIAQAPELVVASWMWGKPLGPLGCPVVRWWMGADIENLQRGSQKPHSESIWLNWAGMPCQLHDLEACGVRGRQLALPTPWEPRVEPWPDEPVVGHYAPPGREERYRFADHLEVARRMPHVQFRVLLKEEGPSLPNVTYLGRLLPEAMPAEVGRWSLILRLITYDGFSLSVQEALALGRHAIWSTPFSGALWASSVDRAVELVRAALALGPNESGVWAIRRFQDEMTARFARYIEDAIEKGAGP